MKTRKPFLLLFAVVASVEIVSAETYSGTCGENLTWELTSDSVLTISGTGPMTNYMPISSVPWYSNRHSIKNIFLPASLTSIGRYAFYDCANLSFVTIPENVTNIGSYAFYKCSSLTNINVPNDVTDISEFTFGGCTNLTSVTLGPSVTNIGRNAFEYCSNLANIEIPQSVTTIGNYAFSGCKSLADVIIPDNVTSIGEDAFRGCTNLKSVIIGNSVTSIGNEAFRSGSSQICVTWNAMNFDLPILETSLSDMPFYYIREQITSFVFGDELEKIPNYLCYGLNNLTSVSIPNSVTHIGSHAFYGCSSLTSVIISDSIKSIGSSAFEDCSGLTSIICESLTPPSCSGSYVFANVDKSIPLYVPAESIELYKAEEVWKEFNIVAIPTTNYTITFLDWDGTVISREQVEEGNAATSPTAPTREGYEFNGWSKSFDNVTEDLFVIALYKETTTTGTPINFIAQDGALIKTDYVTLDIPAAPAVENYTFVGWMTIAEDVTKGITVCATYQKNIPTTAPSLSSESATGHSKIITIDGTLYILTPDGKTYNALGAEVK